MSITKRHLKNGRVRYAVSAWRDGRTHWVGTFATLQEAKRAEADFKAPSGVTYGEASLRWLATRTHTSKNTSDNYGFLVGVTAPIASRTIDEITSSELEELVASLSDRYSPLVVRTAIDTMRQVYKAAMRDGLTDSDPTRGVTNLPKRRAAHTVRALTREEHARMVAQCPEHYRAMLTLWPLVGLRRGEMLGLRWQDVGESLTIRQQYTHGRIQDRLKTESSRRDVPLNATAKRVLEEWRCHAVPNEHDLVFTTEQGSPVHTIAFQSMWAKANAGIGVTSHTLRHTFATWLLLNGVAVQVVSRLLGHRSSAETLKTYAHLLPSSDVDAVDGLSISVASSED